jgi:hypothetical protein
MFLLITDSRAGSGLVLEITFGDVQAIRKTGSRQADSFWSKWTMNQELGVKFKNNDKQYIK